MIKCIEVAEYGVGSDYGKTGCCIAFTDFAGFACVKTGAVKIEAKRRFPICCSI